LIGKLASGLGWLKYLNLCGYWGRSDWCNGEVDTAYLAVSFRVIVVACAAAAWQFDRKDLY
jgi:hypothetical protein